MVLQTALSTTLYTVLLLTKELTSLAREVRQWAHNHGIHWSYHVPHHPEAAGLTERWNDLLKTQFQSQLESSNLESLGRFTQKVIYALNHLH